MVLLRFCCEDSVVVVIVGLWTDVTIIYTVYLYCAESFLRVARGVLFLFNQASLFISCRFEFSLKKVENTSVLIVVLSWFCWVWFGLAWLGLGWPVFVACFSNVSRETGLKRFSPWFEVSATPRRSTR